MAESPVEGQLSPQQSAGQFQKNTTPSSLAHLQTVAQAKAELEGRLAGIHNDLQMTQTIGLLFVKRQEDLKSCFDQLQQLDEVEKQQQQQALKDDETAIAQPLPESFREQLVALDKEFQEGQNGIAGLKVLIDAQLPAAESSTSNENTSARPSSVLGPSAFPSSTLPAQTISKPRRHKVIMSSAPSVNDAAFPLQIQEELLNQVRYWTSQAEMKEKLNQEYDTKINEQERIIDALNKQRRLREESEERQKEDQWNLELQNQELRNQNADLQAQLSKMTHENVKIQKAFASATEQVEQLKDKEEKTASQLELAKTRHEQDMMTMRKHVTGIQREKSELLTKVEDLNATMTLQQQQLAKKATLDAIAHAQEQEDIDNEDSLVGKPELIQAPARFVSGDDAAAGSKGLSSLEPKIASLARETSFAHQQSIISELQAKLSQEITEKEDLMTQKEDLLVEKEELIKMLADREETIETMRLEGDTLEHHSLSKRSSHALFDHPTSRPASGMGLLDDADIHDRRELSMTLSENDSHEFGSGRGSPFPSGGLFAELAQATSQTKLKAPTEYKDQEVMTEPIESWIHTIPEVANLLKSASESPDVITETNSEELSTEAKSEESAADTIFGKPGTETKQIKTLDTVASVASQTVEALAVAAATADDAVEHIQDETEAADPAKAAGRDGTMEEESRDTSDPELQAPVPRASKSDIEDERRHTCDLSQSLVDKPLATVPPVPAIPVDHLPERPSLDDVDRETRVSFGSAFGGDGSAVDTGRIQPVYQTNSESAVMSPSGDTSIITQEADADSSAEKQYTEDTLAAKEQPGAIGADIYDQPKSDDQPEDGPSLPVPAAVAETAAAASLVAAGVASVLNAEADTMPSSEDTSTSQQNGPVHSDLHETTRSQSTLDERKQLHQETTAIAPITTSAIPSTTIVSVSSRTTYTFDKSASQIHLPQTTQFKSDPQYEQLIITDMDSPEVNIGHPILGNNSRVSPNGSISSLSTDYNLGGRYRNGRRMSIGSNYDVTPTDPTMIQIITQTMIGDYLWKYTRRRMANMMSEKRHRRYVWVHPYTKTIYWSQYNPGEEGTREQRAKSALILAVFQISDEGNSGRNSGLPGVSLLIQTTSRNLKLTAPTREKHELWFQSISYLLSRPSSPGAEIPSDNQTWSEVQANNGLNNHSNHHQHLRHKRSLSLGGPLNNDAALSTRQNEKGQGVVRKKGSIARLQGMFGRNSVSREGISTPPSTTTAVTTVGSPRIGPSGLASASASASGLLHSGGVTTTSAVGGTGAGLGNGHENGNAVEKVSVLAYPGQVGKNASVGGVGIVNGGSILAQAEAEQVANGGVKNAAI
ncbi:hypothetical protein BGX28_002388 [Mortierella sp. GBA30]|nr:hypothetical protein BGX28_002388 [Mortierella sp. GBA30]